MRRKYKVALRHWDIRLLMPTVVLAAALMIALPGRAEAQASCGTIQSRVDNAPAGDTVDVPDNCIYRETVILRRSITLIGGDNVEIRGSDVWAGWTKNGSGRWVSDDTLPDFTQSGVCETGTTRCKWPEQVYFDGNPLLQVVSDPQPGQFALNADRQVLLADDPASHVVEVSSRQAWIIGQSKANGVTIEGFAMKHAANSYQSGALRNNAHNNWTVRNNDLSYAHGANVALGAATGLSIVNNDIHHAGQYGITGSKASLEVRDNEIHHNNTEDFDPMWASGGMKIASSRRLVVDGNEIHHNNGEGAWSDIGSENVTYSNNRVHHNRGVGLHLEITDHIEVFGNEVWENGWGAPAGAGDPGIHAVACRDAEVYNNTLAWNNDGISVVNSLREDGFGGTDPKFDRVNDVHVHDNTIVSEDYVAGDNMFALQWRRTYSGGNLYSPASNNRGYDNRYWYDSPEGFQVRYLWSSKIKGLESFNDTLGEENGRYLSGAEKAQVLAAHNIPAQPEREIDTTPPDPPQITDPANGTYKSVRSFTISGEAEPKSIIEIFDGAAPAGTATTDVDGNWNDNLYNVTEGDHVYTAKSTDAVGNTSAASTPRTVTVDTQNPNTTVDSGPDNVDNSTSPSFGFSSTEVGSSFECALDAGSFTPCDSPKGYTGLAVGTHTFKVRAIDQAGNVDAAPASRTWKVDLTAPGAPIIKNPPNNSYKPSKFNVSGTAEPGSTVTLFDDVASVGTAKASSQGNWYVPLTGVAEGPHSYTAVANDPAGNTSASSAVRTVIVDLTAPQVAAPTEDLVLNSSLGSADLSANVLVELTWSGSDTGSGIARYEVERSVAGGPYSPVNPSSQRATKVTLSLEPDKTHRFRARAVDKMGNTSAWTTGKNFTVAVYQEDDPEVSYPSGNWARVTLAGAYGGSLKYANTLGATAKLTFTGDEVGWVSWKATDRGKAEASVDAGAATTVGLSSASAKTRAVVFTKAGLSPTQQHTLEVRVANARRVDVDAFVVLK